MKKGVHLVIITVLFLSHTVLAQKYGVLWMGANTFLISGSDNYHHVGKSGLAFGFMLPVNCPKFDLLYKIKLAMHSADSFNYGDWHKMDHYMMAINELMVSYDFRISDGITIAPQMGFGVMGESMHRELFDGYGSAELFVDFSMMIKHSFRYFGAGVMIGFEKGVNEFSGVLVSDKRLNIALAIYK